MGRVKQGLLLLLLLVSCSSDRNTDQSLLDGGTINLQSSGKIVLINYWALWCAPCRREIPEFNLFLTEHADQVAIVGVNFDGSQGEQLRREVDKLGIEFPILLEDPRSLWGLEPVSVLPETLVIGAQGQLLHRLIGPQTKASLEALL